MYINLITYIYICIILFAASCKTEAMIDWKITVGDPDWNIKTPSTDAARQKT